MVAAPERDDSSFLKVWVSTDGLMKLIFGLVDSLFWSGQAAVAVSVVYTVANRQSVP
jgi:hypothetical protein